MTDFLLIIISAELAAILLLLFIRTNPPVFSHQHQQEFALSNYCTWKYENGRWLVDKDYCQPGFYCGDPPSRLPNFPTEIVRKPATRKR